VSQKWDWLRFVTFLFFLPPGFSFRGSCGLTVLAGLSILPRYLEVSTQQQGIWLGVMVKALEFSVFYFWNVGDENGR
jgi:hypothetical protein